MASRGIGQLFARKSVEQMHAEHAGTELKRTLGPLNLVLLGIGCIIGTGIFVLTGQAAAKYAGPAIMISFVITGVLCAFVALCYAELASAIPVSGSAYSYSYASMGEIVAWVMGLLLVLEYGLAASTVAVGWSGYLSDLLTHNLHLPIPPELTAAPGVPVKDLDGNVIAHGIVNLPALIGIAGVTILLMVGISESATVNNVIVFVKVGVVLAFIAIGVFFVSAANFSPLVPPAEGMPDAVTGIAPILPPVSGGIFGEIWQAIVDTVTGAETSRYGLSGVIHGAAVIFFAYIGFEAVSTAGAESKNPAKDMPIGIIGSLIVCTVLYIATCYVLVGIVPYKELNVPAPIALAANKMGPEFEWFAVLIKVGALAGLSSVMLVLCYGQTRIFYAMSRDGLMPKVFSTINPKTKSPWVNTIVVGLVAGSAAGFMSLDALSNLTNVGSLAAFAIVCLTVLYLRFARPNLARPFRMPTWLTIIVAILGAVMCAILLLSLFMGSDQQHQDTRNFFLLYLVVGFVLYFVYGMRNSKLAKGEYITGHEPNPDLAAAGIQNDDTGKK